MSSKADYLKKYLSKEDGGGDYGKKKKKIKVKKRTNLAIVDDDVDWKTLGLKNVESHSGGDDDPEDAPLVAEFYDEQAEKLHPKWQPVEQKKGFKPIGSSDSSPPRRQLDSSQRSNSSPPRRTSRRHDSPDNSPPRRTSRRHDSPDTCNSPPRQTSRRHDSPDNSPLRRTSRRYDSPDNSPPRQTSRRHDSPDPVKKKSSRWNRSPERAPPRKPSRWDRPGRMTSPSTHRKKGNSPDSSPPRRGRPGKSPESSPPRRTREGKHEAVRTRHDSPDDPCPPRRKRSLSPDLSPPRRKKHSSDLDHDLSPPRKEPGIKTRPPRRASPPRKLPRVSSPDASPPRRKKYDSPTRQKSRHDSPDSDSPPSRPRHDSPDISPPRKVKLATRTSPDLSPPRTKRVTSRGAVKGGRDSDGELRMTSGARSGLQTAKILKEENVQVRERQERFYKELNPTVSGRHAETVYRDKSGRRIDLKAEEARKKEEEREKMKEDEKFMEWGRGVAQVKMAHEKVAEELYEMSKPLARYVDDEDLERMLKEREREGDPMLAFMRKKKAVKESSSKEGEKGKKSKPTYNRPFPPNRFSLRPGYRWDGVNRSNGYEKTWFAQQANKKATSDQAYKWSVEDM